MLPTKSFFIRISSFLWFQPFEPRTLLRSADYWSSKPDDGLLSHHYFRLEAAPPAGVSGSTRSSGTPCAASSAFVRKRR
jgi:hypothetical protein